MMKRLPRCSPWWSLSRMDYCKSTTPLRHLQPGSSPLPHSFLLNSKWCCAFAWWDQPRRSSQAKRARWHSRNWQGDSCGPQSSPTSPLLLCPSLSLSSFPFCSGSLVGVYLFHCVTHANLLSSFLSRSHGLASTCLPLLLLSSFFSFLLCPVIGETIMLAAVENGDAKKWLS